MACRGCGVGWDRGWVSPAWPVLDPAQNQSEIQDGVLSLCIGMMDEGRGGGGGNRSLAGFTLLHLGSCKVAVDWCSPSDLHSGHLPFMGGGVPSSLGAYISMQVRSTQTELHQLFPSFPSIFHPTIVFHSSEPLIYRARMALPTPPLTPPFMSLNLPSPFEQESLIAAIDRSISCPSIPTILTTSPASASDEETHTVSINSAPLPPPSPPIRASSPLPTKTDSKHLQVPTALSIVDFRGLSPILGPREVVSDSEISVLDLGPAFDRSATPSPEPELVAKNAASTCAPALASAFTPGRTRPRKHDDLLDERIVKKRRLATEDRWHVREYRLENVLIGPLVDLGHRRRRTTDSSDSVSTDLDEETSEEKDAVCLKKADRDRVCATRVSKNSRKQVQKVRVSRGKAWHL
ncbi:hypothetical protein BJX70DRAFT_323162 [Aspergillus crustosus]